MPNLSIEDEIYMLIAYKRTNISALARRMGMNRQNFQKKIYNNTLKKEDLCKIAKILGGKYVSYFSFPDGVTIGDVTPAPKAKKIPKQPAPHSPTS